MVKLKAFLLTADYIVLSISGYSFIDILSTMLTGNLALSSMENFVKLLFSIAGLVYLCVRIFNAMMKASLERDLMREEIIAKQNENHKNNAFQHMKEKLTEDNHENLKK